MQNWYGVLLPAGTPNDVRDKLEQALFAVIAEPEIRQRLSGNAIHGMLGHDAFAEKLSKEFSTWPETIKALRITGE